MAKRREPKYVFPKAILEQAKLGYSVQAGSVEGAWPSDIRPAPQANPLPVKKGRAK